MIYLLIGVILVAAALVYLLKSSSDKQWDKDSWLAKTHKEIYSELPTSLTEHLLKSTFTVGTWLTLLVVVLFGAHLVGISFPRLVGAWLLGFSGSETALAAGVTGYQRWVTGVGGLFMGLGVALIFRSLRDSTLFKEIGEFWAKNIDSKINWVSGEESDNKLPEPEPADPIKPTLSEAPEDE